MKRLRVGNVLKGGVSALLAVSAAGLALGAVLAVDAQQKGAWTVGIEPARNTVRLPNSPTNRLPVTVVANDGQAARRPFQARVFVNPQDEGVYMSTLAIPAGKRLIIENVSAIARKQEGLRMTIDFFTYIDNNGDGVGDVADITFHRLALTEQGTFAGTSISTANHKVLVFADEQIGTGHFGVGVQARLTGAAAVPAQAQVTFTGYLENLPTP